MMENQKALTVSELTLQIKSSLELRFPRVWIQGEISNFRRHTSGHLYFSLKDEGAQISATMWRSRAGGLLFQPEDGMKVIARGGITVYPPRGSYQIDVEQLTPVGIGELQLAFEALKRKLAAEGLFDDSRKKRLPRFPSQIGIITSETGAALHDICTVLKRRFPVAQVLLMPVRVQGVGAAEEIAGAIAEMNRLGEADLIIVGRGGGSIEDLWAFNEEVVAHAIAASHVPIVSAVGHEIDFTIADFVADLRAPTPSAAAEMVAPDRTELLELLRNYEYTMRTNVLNLLGGADERVKSLVASYAFNRPKDMVREFVQRVDELVRVMALDVAHLQEGLQRDHDSLMKRLAGLSPANVLRRGYAIVRKGQVIITRAHALKARDEATIQFQDGDIRTTVQ
jgi:exodeoxyribonuclease VII large subunit